jgi:hypothetical protein
VFSSSSVIYMSFTDITYNRAFNGGSGIYFLSNYTIQMVLVTNNENTTLSGDTNFGTVLLGAGNWDIQFIVCTIGNSAGSHVIGINEIDGDSSISRMLNVVFLTNTLSYLYADYNNLRVITNSDTGWTNINNIMLFLPALFTGNTVQ